MAVVTKTFRHDVHGAMRTNARQDTDGRHPCARTTMSGSPSKSRFRKSPALESGKHARRIASRAAARDFSSQAKEFLAGVGLRGQRGGATAAGGPRFPQMPHWISATRHRRLRGAGAELPRKGERFKRRFPFKGGGAHDLTRFRVFRLHRNQFRAVLRDGREHNRRFHVRAQTILRLFHAWR